MTFKVGDRVCLTGGGWGELGVWGEVVVVSRVDSKGRAYFTLGDSEYLVGGPYLPGVPGDFFAEVVDSPVNESDHGDPVDHPAHYTSDPSGVECIQITRHRNFNVGNAIKYLWRNGLKDEPGTPAKVKQVEDLRKAIWYIEDEIKRIEGSYE